jgi:hypothetical protein
MPGRCRPLYKPCGNPDLVPKVGEDAVVQAPYIPSDRVAIETVDLTLVPWIPPGEKPPGPRPPSFINVPPPPVLYYNEAMIVTGCCDLEGDTNSVSVLVPSGTFSAWGSQEAANQQASDYWHPIVEAELNCSDVTTVAITGDDLGVVTAFVEEQFGGVWLSEPWSGDAYLTNEFSCQ